MRYGFVFGHLIFVTRKLICIFPGTVNRACMISNNQMVFGEKWPQRADWFVANKMVTMICAFPSSYAFSFSFFSCFCFVFKFFKFLMLLNSNLILVSQRTTTINLWIIQIDWTDRTTNNFDDEWQQFRQIWNPKIQFSHQKFAIVKGNTYAIRKSSVIGSTAVVQHKSTKQPLFSHQNTLTILCTLFYFSRFSTMFSSSFIRCSI